MALKSRTIFFGAMCLFSGLNLVMVAGYGNCRADHFKTMIGRVCAVYIKRSVVAAPNPGSPMYNSFTELEYFMRDWISENQPEPEELTQLPVLSRHRPPPTYDDAKMSAEFKKLGRTKPVLPHGSYYGRRYTQPRPTPPHQGKVNPAVKLYFPMVPAGRGYREEWYTPQVRTDPENMEGLSPVGNIRAATKGVLEELQEPLNESPMSRLKRTAALQSLIIKCCNFDCTPHDWVDFARENRICE